MNPKRELDAAECIAREVDDRDGPEGSHVRELLDAALARAEDKRTLSDRRLRRSLDEMRSGELIDITPSA